MTRALLLIFVLASCGPKHGDPCQLPSTCGSEPGGRKLCENAVCMAPGVIRICAADLDHPERLSLVLVDIRCTNCESDSRLRARCDEF